MLAFAGVWCPAMDVTATRVSEQWTRRLRFCCRLYRPVPNLARPMTNVRAELVATIFRLPKESQGECQFIIFGKIGANTKVNS